MPRTALLPSRTGRQRLAPKGGSFWPSGRFHGASFSMVSLLGVPSSRLAVRRDGCWCLGPAPCQGGWESQEGRPSSKLRCMWCGAPQTRGRGAGAGHPNAGRKPSAAQKSSKWCPAGLRRCFQRASLRLDRGLSTPGARQTLWLFSLVSTLELSKDGQGSERTLECTLGAWGLSTSQG